LGDEVLGDHRDQGDEHRHEQEHHEEDGCGEQREGVRVEIGASASAGEMTFNNQPRTHVKSRIESPGRSRSTSFRRNLPDHVQAGETYHDVEVGYKICPQLTEKSTGQPQDPGHEEQERPDTADSE
jgi:hypothetical protein